MEYNQLFEEPTIIVASLLSHGWTSYDFEVNTEFAITKGMITLAEQLGTPVALRAGGKLCDNCNQLKRVLRSRIL